MFNDLPQVPEDTLHAVMGRFNADQRPHKIDLGVGVYREADGTSPIMASVTQAQSQLLQEETSKSYLALRGNELFLDGMAKLAFGRAQPSRVAGLQSVGGTGAVRLGIELAANANPDLRVHVGLPTWPNHLGICGQLKLPCKTWPYFDVATARIDVDATFGALDEANPGDVFVLHGPCHNPSGADLASAQLLSLVERAGRQGVIPLIDAAYYGLGNELDNDLDLLAECSERAPEVLIVMSCSKAFGLYRERTGVLFACCESSGAAARAQATLEFMARGSYSMPPNHGAAVVGKVLADSGLRAKWRAELASMRERIVGIRQELAAAAPELAEFSGLEALSEQRGIFSLLALDASEVGVLARDEAIYLPDSGRINVAGFKAGDVSRFTAALARLR